MILQFQSLPVHFLDIILPWSLEFNVETWMIYLHSFGKLIQNIPITKKFKLSQSNDWFLLLLVVHFEMKKLSEYLPSMKLDGYSFELCQERVDKWETVR